MKDNEIVQALRCCAKGLGHDDACENCKVGEIQDRREYIEFAAANMIERLTAENAAARKEIEWKDMVIALAQRKQVEAEAERDAMIEQIKERHDCRDCKHNDFCDFDSYTVLDCMHCVPEVCPCAGCFDSSRWEWRGLPEAPEEGEKALAEMEGKA